MLGRLLKSLFGGKPRPPAPDSDPMEQALRCQAAGELRQAAALYQAVVDRDPGRRDALERLGLCQAMLGDMARAGDSFGRLLRLDPRSASAHMNLGNVALATQRPSEASGHYEQALALSGAGREAPQNADLVKLLGMSLQRRGLPEQAIECFQALLRGRPDHADARVNLAFAMQHTPQASPQQVFDVLRGWARYHEQPLLPLQRPHANAREAGRRLRLGYVSGDFFDHAVANFIEPVLRHHDRNAFEVHAYYSRATRDAQTAVLQGLCDRWTDIAGMSDEAAAARIRAEGIDLLVDLSSHTQAGRLGIFARKPAPLQFTWLGYPTTTGLASIDYRITDAVADPPGVAEGFHSERLLRLPRSQWCYRPRPGTPPVAPLPALQAGHVTFGSFNNLSKLNGEVLALWAAVLRERPGSRITVACIPDEPSRRRVADTLVGHGADPAQVRVLGTLDEATFWNLRAQIDIVLDAFPYNGTTTTCEALWAGLPVVTLAGSHGAARSSASLLSAVGLPELIAADAAGFVAIATTLADDLPRLAQLRAGLRQRLLESGLCDGPRFTRELETLYRDAWRDWCARPAR